MKLISSIEPFLEICFIPLPTPVTWGHVGYFSEAYRADDPYSVTKLAHILNQIKRKRAKHVSEVIAMRRCCVNCLNATKDKQLPPESLKGESCRRAGQPTRLSKCA